MALLAGLFYLLMSMRVRARLHAHVCGRHARVYAEIAYLGLCVRIGGLPEHGREKPPDRREEGWRRKLERLHRNAEVLGRFLSLEDGGIYLRLGLEDAAQTALAAGLCSAALHAAAASPACRGRCAVRVEPDYRTAVLIVHAQGIFSAAMGDIVFEALKAAFRKSKTRIRHRSGVKQDGKASH